VRLFLESGRARQRAATPDQAADLADDLADDLAEHLAGYSTPADVHRDDGRAIRDGPD
jgi:hypothetical protein